MSFDLSPKILTSSTTEQHMDVVRKEYLKKRIGTRLDRIRNRIDKEIS